MNILLIPTTDWLGHPFPSRLNHIFEKIAEKNTVHVLRFAFYPKHNLRTKTVVHEIDETKNDNLALYYLINSFKHFEAVRRIVKENDVDVVVISNLLAGYMAAKAVGNRASILFDLSDHFPSIGAGYHFNLNSVSGKISMFALEQVLKKTLNHATQIVTCSHPLKSYVERFGFKNNSIVPNGMDDFFLRRKHETNLIREKLGLGGYLTVGYLGSIEFWLDLPPLLEAIQRVTESQKVKLLLVGCGLRTKTIQNTRKQIERLGIEDNVVWVNSVPYTEVPNYIGAMDICTIPFAMNHPTAYYSAPNKLLEYLALEKIVVATPIPDIVYTARNYVNFATTAKDYARIFEGYNENYEAYKEKARAGRKLAEQMTWTKIAQKYERLLVDQCIKSQN